MPTGVPSGSVTVIVPVGENVTIVGNEVRDTLMAGILLYPAPQHNTYAVRNVTVDGNRLDGVSLNRGLAMGLAVLHRPQLTIRQMVAEDPEHEIELFTELFWNRVQHWRANNVPSGKQA